MKDGQPPLPAGPSRFARPFVDIAVPVPAGTPGRPAVAGRTWRDASFTYAIPPGLDGRLLPGHVVWVPFGRRRVQGVVVAFRRRSHVERTRDVLEICDTNPALTVEQIGLAQWMCEHYMAPFFDCLRAMLPPGGLSQTEQRFRRTAQSAMLQALPPEEQAVLGAFGRDRELSAAQVRSRSGLRSTAPALERLVHAGLLTVETRLAGPRIRQRRERVLQLTVDDADERDATLLGLRRSRRADVVAYLRHPDCEQPTVERVVRAAGADRSVVRGLAASGVVSMTEARQLVGTDLSPEQAESLGRGELDRAPAQARLLTVLAESVTPLERGEALRRAATGPSVLKALVERGVAHEDTDPGTVLLNSRGARAREIELQLRHLERHAAVLDYLAASGGIAAWPAVRDHTGASAGALRDLESAGLVEVGDRRVWRDPLAGRSVEPSTAPSLTPDQLAAWELIEPLLEACAGRRLSRPRTCLVYGVTGSGKTELYLTAIERVLDQGRQAIVLVPEIAQTPQTVARIAARFPGRIGVWHSELSDGERYDTWQRTRDGQIDVIVGSRSAVFAPLPRLGLIVADEEHSDAFKQERTPRYHARSVAVRRAALSGATVILGSATPSVDSYWAALRGTYRLAEMPHRVVTTGSGFAYADLPPVDVVDMRAELRDGNTSIFSRELHAALGRVLEEGEQAILFLNRRGSATFVSCRDCGYVQACPRCQAPLTYHGRGRVLVCHHCNHRQPPPMMCPECGSPRIRYFGAGTQRIEHEVGERFPEARVLRWDADTTGRKGAHEALLARFAGGGADVLVGTQMVAKGLDLPRVTLVGVVSADTSLHLPDIWSRERTFQLLCQVAGRAGRSALGGRVVFQTYQPHDPAIRYAAAHDYAGFYASEIAYRAEQGYPPFRGLVRLEYVSESGERAAQREAERFAGLLRHRIDQLGLSETDIVGPAPAFFGHVRGRARWQVVVRSDSAHELLAETRVPPGWRIDVDPVSLL